MGFGFNLFFVFILLPLAIILIILIIIKRSKFLTILLLSLLGVVFGIIIFSFIVRYFTDKRTLTVDDIYGEYVIDRDFFKGRQTDWQYDHYRLELTRQNRFKFYVTDNSKIVRTYKGSISFVDNYASPRIVFNPDSPRHHIIDLTPTLYRSPFSFYYVFYSPKFGNVFFTKGNWKPIE